MLLLLLDVAQEKLAKTTVTYKKKRAWERQLKEQFPSSLKGLGTKPDSPRPIHRTHPTEG